VSARESRASRQFRCFRYRRSIDRDALVAEAGLGWQASDTISLGVSYSGQIGSGPQDHTLKGSFVWTL
jgi:uncharacterized protein with beta-barrel porin domain